MHDPYLVTGCTQLGARDLALLLGNFEGTLEFAGATSPWRAMGSEPRCFTLSASPAPLNRSLFNFHNVPASDDMTARRK